jgi:cytidyltransferase-like protein
MTLMSEKMNVLNTIALKLKPAIIAIHHVKHMRKLRVNERLVLTVVGICTAVFFGFCALTFQFYSKTIALFVAERLASQTSVDAALLAGRIEPFFGWFSWVALCMSASGIFVFFYGQRLARLAIVGADHSPSFGLSYVSALERVNSSMRFLGVGAYKITCEDEFAAAADRVFEHRNGRMDFLLCDPLSNVLPTYAKARKKSSAEHFQHLRESLERLRAYKASNPNRVKIKFYRADDLLRQAATRLMFINNEECVVTPQSFGGDDMGTKQPQLLLAKSASSNTEANLYRSFQTYFDLQWQGADECYTVDDLDTLISRIRERETYGDPSVSVRKATGCVHGRFQPPHLHHLEYVQGALKRCDKLLIGITQPNNQELRHSPHDLHRSQKKNNPLTYEERCRIIRQMLVEEKVDPESFEFVRFDIDQPSELVSVVKQDIVCYTTICDEWNFTKIATLRTAGYAVVTLKDRRDGKIVRGIEIRNLALKNDARWKRDLHPSTVDILEEIGFLPRLRELNKEA